MNYIQTKGMSNEDWLRHRKDGIGGSDCSAVLGFNKYRTPIDVWIDKTNPDMIQDITNTSMEIGHLAEHAVVKPLFCKQEGKRVMEDHKIRIHPEHDILRANLDGVVLDYGEGPGVWEAKTILERVLNSEEGMYPVAHYLQCQHNMMVTGYGYAWLSMWIKDRDTVVSHYIERNDKLISEIKQRELEFWDRHVIGGECPPAVTDEDLKKIYPESKPLKIEATPQIFEDAVELQDVKEKLSEMTDEKKRLEFNIKDFMGENQILEHDGKTICTFKTSYTLNEESLENDLPDVYKKYTKNEPVFDKKAFKKEKQGIHDAYKTTPKNRRFNTRTIKTEPVL